MKLFIDSNDIDNTISVTELPLDTNPTDSVDDFSGALACLFDESCPQR